MAVELTRARAPAAARYEPPANAHLPAHGQVFVEVRMTVFPGALRSWLLVHRVPC